MEKFNISMRKYLKEVGVTSQQAIERMVREEELAGKGKLKVKMVLTGEGPTSGMWSKARSTSLTHMISRRDASRRSLRSFSLGSHDLPHLIIGVHLADYDGANRSLSRGRFCQC